MSFHKCGLPGCTRRIPTHLFLCRIHWHVLPAYLKARLNAAYDVYHRATCVGPVETKAAVKELRHVQHDVVLSFAQPTGGED